MKTLVLDQTYAPVDLIDWQRAVTLLLTGKAETLEEGDRIIKSPSIQIKVPKVLRLIRARARKIQAAFSRKAVIARDRNICCYCNKVFPTKSLTIDHVKPRCQGGNHNWLNTVTACQKCNFKKGGKTPEEAGMKMNFTPSIPTHVDLVCAAVDEFGSWIWKSGK